MTSALDLLESRPYFDIEATARCNLRCSICPREGIARGPGAMDTALFDRLRSWLPRSSRVVFSGLGEPLLHARLPDFIKALTQDGHTVGVTTNGMLLSSPSIGALISAGLDVLYISFLSSDPETSRKITGEGVLTKLLENLDRWAADRPASLTTYLTTVLFEENAGERETLRALAKERGFLPLFRPRHSRGGALYTPETLQAETCGVFAKVTFIAWNGDVLPCCNDLAGKKVIGNVETHTFEKIREGKRRRLMEGEWFEPCAACDDAYRTDLLRDGALDALEKLEDRERSPTRDSLPEVNP
ncbi:MAG: radical SAM/SPASM domain-containing protein [Planctomycetota bacterium]